MSQQHAMERIFSHTRRIAVVGLSDRPMRTSHGVSRVMRDMGFEIVPVNPLVDEVFGLQSYPDLASVPGDIDLVNVFRRQEHLVDVAEQCVARGGIRGVWLQLGLASWHARDLITSAGMDYVENRCIKVEAARLRHRMALPAEDAAA